MIVKASPAQLGIFQWKAQWFNQVERCPSVGAQANDIARVRRNFRLEQNNIKHRLDP